MAYRLRAVVEELGDVELCEALLRLRGRRQRVLLESARGYPSRFGVLGFDPLPPRPRESVFAPRELLLQLTDAGGDVVPGMFAGGFLGALSYDLGVEGERAVRCASEPWGFPRATGGLYVDFLVRDERERRTWLVLGDEPGDGRAPLAQRSRDVRAALASQPAPEELACGPVQRSVSSAEHMARVERCRRLIAAGEVYQANLAHRMTTPVRGAPDRWFARLRERNPAPYMGFAEFEGGALLSASPELLLEFDGAHARTRPIKGTIARASEPAEDASARAALLASDKDRAELAMIVDLERNDLGRVARPGGVWVEGFPHLESYARVHHLMADVVAEVSSGVDACAVLAALFPGGSITGAPKLRAMEVIAELEGEGRGFYCGSMGFVDLRGRAAFNILIRTLQWRSGGVSSPWTGELGFRVGGGITWQSSPAAEDAETLAKAAGLLDALAGTGVVAPTGAPR